MGQSVRFGFAIAALAALSLGCGGGKKGDGTGPGDHHVAQDLDESTDGSGTAGTPGDPLAPDGGVGEMAGDAGAAEPTSLVTFELSNSHDVPLEFSIEKGWSLIVSGYSGKPGEGAEPIILFPKHCTASCDAPEEERCPLCEEPEDSKAEKEAEMREVVEPGETYALAWDGMVHVYEKTKGKRDGRTKRCQCHRKEMVPANSYTLRACGLRVTKSAKKTSKYQCVTTEVDLPPAEPTTITFDFGDPKAQAAGNKKKKKSR